MYNSITLPSIREMWDRWKLKSRYNEPRQEHHKYESLEV